jgi:hypothetical protein
VAPAGGAVGTQVGSESSTQKCPALPPGQHVKLVLPAPKALHADIYSPFIWSRRLQHRVGRNRDTRQREKWDRMMRRGLMLGATWDEGRRLGLCNRQILRPIWTRGRLWPDTQVDHIIEHQTATIGGEAAFDEPWNFELLDQASNGSAGSQLDNNIAGERARLVTATGDPRWASCDITFTLLDVAGSAPAGRWSADEVATGEHLIEFLRSGRTPRDVGCPED